MRVRFAPSPTGPLHPGGVRTALFNYLLVRRHGGQMILRIEDTDQTRFVPGAEAFIIESLSWCGITFDEGVHKGGPFGPYRQSERKDMYRSYALQLVESGHAYYAFDTEEELEKMREEYKASGVVSPQYNAVSRVRMKNALSLPSDEVERRLQAGDPYVIRFKMPRGREVRVQDRIRGLVVVQTAQLDDKVLFKSDGMPTYHLANVVDDRLMEITHVIRGEEWLPSTPLHVLLYEAFGWQDTMPEFAHLPLLLKPDGDGKLSKRDGDRLGLPFYATEWTNPETGEKTPGYRESGYFPEAYVNFLALLGWNPGDHRELFGMEELIDVFSLDRVNKHGARYDFTKLLWFNQQYLRLHSVDSLLGPCAKLLTEQGWTVEESVLKALIPLVQDRMALVSDFVKEVRPFFVDPESYDESVVAKKWGGVFPAVLAQLIQGYEAGGEEWGAAVAEALFKDAAAAHGVSPGSLLQGLRLAVTGEASGPALFEWMGLRGRSACVARLRRAAAALPLLTSADSS